MLEGCFIFQFASIPLEVGGPFKPTLRTKVAVIQQQLYSHNGFSLSLSRQTRTVQSTLSGLSVKNSSERDLFFPAVPRDSHRLHQQIRKCQNGVYCGGRFYQLSSDRTITPRTNKPSPNVYNYTTFV